VLFDGVAATIASIEGRPALHVAVEVLAGGNHEPLLDAAEAVTTQDDVYLFQGRHLTGGFALARTGLDLEAATEDLYRRLFAATDGLHLHRIWNYVPHINRLETTLENYRLFCRARSLAFETRLGKNFKALLPASSAVGASAGPLAVAFVAGTTPGWHFENPRQVPAFDYPSEHGPRPPSFSRATVADTGELTHVFISGTAAIRGHATVAPGELEPQLECTLDNLRLIGAAAGAGPTLGADGAWERRFKVYLRHPDDLRRVISRLESGLLLPHDHVVYLHADICRAELVVEIEATLSRRQSPG
jgi:hypothetical protein